MLPTVAHSEEVEYQEYRSRALELAPVAATALSSLMGMGPLYAILLTIIWCTHHSDEHGGHFQPEFGRPTCSRRIAKIYPTHFYLVTRVVLLTSSPSENPRPIFCPQRHRYLQIVSPVNSSRCTSPALQFPPDPWLTFQKLSHCVVGGPGQPIKRSKTTHSDLLCPSPSPVKKWGKRPLQPHPESLRRRFSKTDLHKPNTPVGADDKLSTISLFRDTYSPFLFTPTQSQGHTQYLQDIRVDPHSSPNKSPFCRHCPHPSSTIEEGEL